MKKTTGIPGEHPDEKTARIRRGFDQIAARHGLTQPVREVTDTTPALVVDIVVGGTEAGDSDFYISGDIKPSQIMEGELPVPVSKTPANIPTLSDVTKETITIERNYLQKRKSTITFVYPNGELVEYIYIGKSKAEDPSYTQKAFLKIQNKKTGRIDIWNGVLSPIGQVRYAEGRADGTGYSEKPFPFNKIDFKY